VTKSSFKQNFATIGGGILQEEGDLFINNSTFSMNKAAKGGGLYNHGDLPTNPF
jgi:hypothetical protein